MTYLAVMIVGLILSLRNDKGTWNLNLYLLILLTLASFRYGVGPDYFGYEFLYSLLNQSRIETLYDATDQELLFKLYGMTLNSLDLSYQAYLAITALISIYYVGKTCRRYSEYPMTSLYLYYCFFYFVWVFSGIRQGLTLAIGSYYLLQCAESRNHKKFIFIVFLLSLVHASSWFLLLFYAMTAKSVNRKALLLVTAFCFIVSLLPPSVIMGFIKVFPFSERVEFYYRPEADDLGVNYLDFKSISRLVLLLLFGVFYAKKPAKEHDIQDKMVNVYLFSFAFYYALKFIEVLAQNGSMYGFVLLVLIIPNAYKNSGVGRHSPLLLLLGLLLSLAFFFKTLISMEDLSGMKSPSLLPPYTHVFEEIDSFRYDRRRQVE